MSRHATTKAREKRLSSIPPHLRCERCGGEKSVWYRQRPHCAMCDDAELFGGVPASDLFTDGEGGSR